MELPPNFDKLMQKLRHSEPSLMVSADCQVSSVPLYQFPELKSRLIEALDSCSAPAASWTAQGVQFVRRPVRLRCPQCAAIINAANRLSPATRRLLIERPEAVEACVEAVIADKVSRMFQDVSGYMNVESKECLKVEANEAMSKAIAALPEEET